MDRTVSESDFELLDEFRKSRARIAAAKALDRDVAAQGARRRAAPPKPVPKESHVKVSPSTGVLKPEHLTQAPQYAGREEALAAKQQTEEEMKKEKTEVRSLLPTTLERSSNHRLHRGTSLCLAGCCTPILHLR